ncbi:LOG family protein, partial [Neisseria gonorrhoeae]
ALTDNGGVRDNVIATGGGPGIMEAANRGASDAGAPSIGFNITLPREQKPNPYSTPGLTFQFHYFAMRKMHLAMRANALVAFPGGFGTFDELFEIITLRQTNKSPAIPIVLFDEKYWRSAVNFDVLIDNGMV